MNQKSSEHVRNDWARPDVPGVEGSSPVDRNDAGRQMPSANGNKALHSRSAHGTTPEFRVRCIYGDVDTVSWQSLFGLLEVLE